MTDLQSLMLLFYLYKYLYNKSIMTKLVKPSKLINSKSLSEWLFFYENLHHIGIDMGLSRVDKVWKSICLEKKINKIAKQKIITVAGTNGKGSSCKMLVVLLRSLGFTVGCEISPHILTFNERIQINESNASDIDIIEAFKIIEKSRGDITLSYFEVAILASFIIFWEKKVDFVILEVGLGGRLDATNIIDADASIITSIGLDHINFLGDNIDNIALEKAGVFRTKQVAVYGDENISPKLLDFCKDNKISLMRLGVDYKIVDENYIKLKGHPSLKIPKSITKQGQHQHRNLAGVLQILSSLSLLENINLSDYINSSLAEFSITGRLQKIANNPDIIIDVAHNVAAAYVLSNYIKTVSKRYNKIHLVIGILKDKDIKSILKCFFDINTNYYLGTINNKRGASAKELSKFLTNDANLEIKPELFENINQALNKAKDMAQKDDLIVCFGSFFVVSDILNKNKYS